MIGPPLPTLESADSSMVVRLQFVLHMTETTDRWGWMKLKDQPRHIKIAIKEMQYTKIYRNV